MTTSRLLALEHRQQQIRLSAQVIYDLLRIWPLFDPTRIDQTWSSIEEAIMLIVQGGRTRSVALSTAYYSAARSAAGVTTPLPAISLSPRWEIAARTSLNVTGPVLTKSAVASKRPLELLAKEAFTRVSGSATRHAMNGGREAMVKYMLKDQVRYRRVTAPRACPFCTMLRGRGAVYVKETAGFRAHDHCSCTAEPVFR